MKHVFNKSFLLAITALLCTICYGQGAINPSIKPAKSGYAPVNGLNVYYEIYGEGQPLVLLHGSFMTIGTNWGHLIPELSKSRKVIAIEFQGHGHTNDSDRDYSFENFADDVAGVLKHLKVDSTDIVGYSLGAGVGLQVAIRHPQLVRRLVHLSAPFKWKGWSEETRSIFPIITAQFFEGTPVKTEYDKYAPDTKHFSTMVSKLVKMINTDYDFTNKISAIKQPILVILGDSDGIVTEHAAEMFKLMGGGKNGDMAGIPASQLTILPGTSHTGLILRSDWLLNFISTFLK